MATKKAKRAKTSASASRNAKVSVSAGPQRWGTDEDKNLKTLIKQNTPTRLIAMKLKRTEGAVRQRVSRLGLSLKPTNRSPYG